MSIQEFEPRLSETGVMSDITTTHEDVVAPHKTFELHVLTDPEELLEARRLRASVYVDEMGFLEAGSRDADGGEHDHDDTRSIHFGVYANNTEPVHLAATSRLIVKGSDSEEDRLPIEKYFDVKVPAGSVEASRLVVEPNKRANGSDLLVSAALMRAMMHHALDMEVDYVYAVVEDGLYNHFLKIGLPAEVIAEPEFIEEYNTSNLAIRFKADAVIGAMWDKDLTFRSREVEGKYTTRPNKMAHFFAGSRTTLGQGEFDFDDLTPPEVMFSRNRGFFSNSEQERLRNATVAIAGAGGDGGLLAEQMVRAGVGKIRLADPEEFGPENINRQAFSGMDVVGMNKAMTVARGLLKINPWLDVEVYTDGVTGDNIEDFSHDADLIIDETEFTMPELGTMINREARKIGAPVLMAMNIGFGAQVTSFVEGRGKTFEQWLGIPDGMPLDEVKDYDVEVSKWLAHLPSYASLDVFQRVSNGEMSAPSLAGGVALAAGVASEQAMRHLLTGNKRGRPVVAPGAIYVDPVDGMKTVRNTKHSFYRSLAKVIARNKLGLIPDIH
ncbi:ThiF family adenylyltransferase [Candidatus Saccharibacteria bacterium]|nr:ThiF family adenylyltransferase [Candidatus Saccharibacteria bacterium]